VDTPRNEFLSSACLAGDQYSSIAFGYTLHQIDDPTNGIALTDDFIS
jgi:hypothetical protein